MRGIRPFLLTICVFVAFNCRADSVKGIWQGVLTSDELVNETNFTLNVKAEDGNLISGRAYVYYNFLYVFYGAFDFIGTVENDRVKITELRIRSSELPDPFHSLCIKYGNMLYSTNDTAEYLTGRWGNSKGGCSTGEMYLKRIIPGKTSNIKVPADILRRIAEDKTDDIPFMQTTLMKPVLVTITSATIKVSVYDYMRDDGDTVSVFLNRDPVMSRIGIRKKKYEKTIKLDKLSTLNELILFAENLGRVPPNTCVLMIDDGKRKQNVNITSTLQKSAAIYLKYEPGD